LFDYLEEGSPDPYPRAHVHLSSRYYAPTALN